MDLAAAIAFDSPRHGEAWTVQVGPIADASTSRSSRIAAP